MPTTRCCASVRRSVERPARLVRARLRSRRAARTSRTRRLRRAACATGGWSSAARDARRARSRRDRRDAADRAVAAPTTTSRTSRAPRSPRSRSACRRDVVSACSQRFGADPADNPGRLMRYDYRGAQVLIDYAHNPDGLARPAARSRITCRATDASRCCSARPATARRPTSRSSPRTAARIPPGLRIVVKETEAYLRGRAPGEVPAILRGGAAARGDAARRRSTSA